MDENRTKVLLVDDEADFRRPVAKRLVRRGLDVREAGCGRDALALLRDDQVHVVVLDVKMPEMDGLEVLNLIKAGYPRIEVILLTGQATAQDGVAGIKAGAFDYLTKPIELEHLLSKINQARETIRHQEEQEQAADYQARMEQRMTVAERLASLGTMAAGIAHEINNPLAIISESAGWLNGRLARDDSLPRDFRSNCELALGKISASVDRARRITHQLLDFARQTDSTVKRFDLECLLAEVIDLTKKLASDAGAELSYSIQSEAIELWTDPYQLRQVLINLVTNGLHAAGSGGRVSLSAVLEGPDAAITVEDNGPGIPPENLDRIFEPFFSTKPPGQGTGLGLSVSRGLVEKLGGRIEVRSRLGAGAAFKVVIPRQLLTSLDRVAGPVGK